MWKAGQTPTQKNTSSRSYAGCSPSGVVAVRREGKWAKSEWFGAGPVKSIFYIFKGLFKKKKKKEKKSMWQSPYVTKSGP